MSDCSPSPRDAADRPARFSPRRRPCRSPWTISGSSSPSTHSARSPSSCCWGVYRVAACSTCSPSGSGEAGRTAEALAALLRWGYFYPFGLCFELLHIHTDRKVNANAGYRKCIQGDTTLQQYRIESLTQTHKRSPSFSDSHIVDTVGYVRGISRIVDGTVGGMKHVRYVIDIRLS